MSTIDFHSIKTKQPGSMSSLTKSPHHLPDTLPAHRLTRNLQRLRIYPGWAYGGGAIPGWS